ncbi:DgyrCDS3326 [Dimorphilus gyrociliatus]|uniref:DgyrCDS3326 n=1 Tax=Dimorphilus gyrociliatus TaxID=2664684 RepID=A0A7I8VCV9_9ANNE|nr:DgyrCDS3326 [Dimorphilus gyrociliatus]
MLTDFIKASLIFFNTANKSMPIHCIVEKTPSTVEVDSYAILSNSTPFNEIVGTALQKLGFSTSQSVGAKGTIQIKNWKALTFDTITDNPDATVEDLLADLTSVVTLRIRLCSSSRVSAIDEIKEKLLKFLLTRSIVTLQNAGCPIDQNLLNRFANGDFTVSEATAKTFDQWYKKQSEEKVLLNGGGIGISPGNGMGGVGVGLGGLGGTSSDEAAKRARTSFDPEHEIPRLQTWFKECQHPSKEQMTTFLDELNSLESRKGRKPLDLTNIVYWFKNTRAAMKRSQNKYMTDENENEAVQSADAESEGSRVPELPNSNAIYVFNPNNEEEEEEDDFNESESDFEEEKVKKEHHEGSSSIKQEPENIKKRHLSEDDDEPRHVTPPAFPTFPPFTSQSQALHNAMLHNPLAAAASMQLFHPAAAALYTPSILNTPNAHAQQYPSPTSAPGPNETPTPPSGSSLPNDERKKRSRVFIDPLSEIPKLEKWFGEDTHPSSYMIEKYTEELNRSEYRHRFPRLEPKNVQLWFKNHRAKVKRARLELPSQNSDLVQDV